MTVNNWREASLDVDSKWSWVMLAAGILIRVIESGIYVSIGILVPVLAPYLHTSRSVVALTGGLNLGCQFFFGMYFIS